MSALSRCLTVAAWAGLLFLTGCRYPTVADLWKQPLQAVELTLEVDGKPVPVPAEATARLVQGLGLPAYAAGSGDPRVLRVALKGRPTGTWAGSAVKTSLRTSGFGLLFGAAAATGFGYGPVNGPAIAIGAGAGFVLGLGYGPFAHHAQVRQSRELGYFPWSFGGELIVMVPGADGALARIQAMPLAPQNPAPHLQPLPPDRRSEAEIRDRSLEAYAEALARYLVKQGLVNPRRP